MRLLIYGINFSPELTGIGPYTADMAKWFAARGHEVDVITSFPHYPEWRVDSRYSPLTYHKDRLAGVRVLRAPIIIPKRRPITTYTRIVLETSFMLASARYWLGRILYRPKPDAVIAICPPLQMGLIPLLYGLIRHVPWIFHVQDLQVDAAARLGLIRSSMLNRLLYRVENILLRRANRVSTITEAMRQRIFEKGIPLDRILLLPNWADLENIKPESRNNAVRKSLEIGLEKIVCMYSGTMGVKQGLEVVIDAARLLKEDQRFCFVLVGDGARKGALQQAAKGLDNVLFFNVQPKEQLNDLLASGDIHLIIQKREAADLVMPSKLANTMAAGRPVIAAAEEGTTLHNTVTVAGAGLVIEPENSADLVSAILQLAESNELRNVYGRKGRQWAESNLSIDAVLGKFECDLAQITKEV